MPATSTNRTGLHVALGTTNARIVSEVKNALKGEAWQLLIVPTAADLWTQLKKQDIQVILMDLQWAHSQTLLPQLAKHRSDLPLLVLATAQQFDALQQAMLDGATSFILQPIEPQRLRATLRCATHTQTLKQNRMVAITGLSGGVGRSTIAANLAVALHQRYAVDVMLLEGHSHLSSLAKMLNLYPVSCLADLAQSATLATHIVEGYFQRHSSGICTLTAPTAFTPWIEIPLETWQSLLACVASLSAFVIIDTAAIADALLSHILAQADEILIVTTPEATRWRTAVALLETLQEAEEVQARIHMLLNKADMRNGLQTFFLRQQVKVPFISIGEDGGLAIYALNRGVPFVLSHPHTLLSRQIYRLADDIYAAAGTDTLDTASSLRTTPQTGL